MNKPMYLLWVGLLIGAVIAVALSSAIALSMFATDCPWPILWETWGKLLVLTIPTCSATVATVLLLKHAVPKEIKTLPAATSWVEKKDVEENTDETLAGRIVRAAHELAEFYYVAGQNPTRRLFEQEMGMTQALWGSAHSLLLAAGITDKSNKWVEESWIVIKATLDKIHADYDRIWVRPLGTRDMLSVPVGK